MYWKIFNHAHVLAQYSHAPDHLRLVYKPGDVRRKLHLDEGVEN